MLLHVCCGPCSLTPVKYLREQGWDIRAYFFNPNIHPEEEYDLRRAAMAEAARQWAVPMLWEGGAVPPAQWLQGLCAGEGGRDFGQRCLTCYAQRLEATARAAAAGGFAWFSTSLLYSRYQNQEGIRAAGEAAGAMFGVGFHFEDFRPHWQEGIALSKALGLYRQKWCGCILSRDESLQMMAEKAARKAARAAQMKK